MARRLALLALLAGWTAVAARRHLLPPPYDAFDPFRWDGDDYDYDESPRSPVPAPPLSAKVPKVNFTVKNIKVPGKKNIVKATSIHIESYTSVVVTKKPRIPAKQTAPKRPAKKPAVKTKVKKNRPPVTRRPTTKRAPTRLVTSTVKTPKVKTTAYPPKKGGWLSSFFQEKVKKAPQKKPEKPPWFLGIFSTVYQWFWGPGGSESWFGGFFDESEAKTPATTTTTTTTRRPSTTNNWFYALLESEEDDGAYTINETKKTPKKFPKKNYKGYQLLRAYPDVQWKVHELLDLQEEAQGSGVGWWSAPSLNGPTDVLVPPDLLPDIKDHLNTHKIDFDVVIWDLQKAITYENPRLSKKQRMELEQLRGHPLTWRRYHRYSDILRYFEYLQHSRSDIVELMPLGRSSEGLPLVAVKVSLPSNDSHTTESYRKSASEKKKWKLRSRMKPAVWIEGGAHAQEWITPAVATWMLHALTEGEKGFGAEHELLRQADFYIMPLVNPDGYEHSHTHDRLWSKTRSRHGDNVDLYYTGCTKGDILQLERRIFQLVNLNDDASFTFSTIFLTEILREVSGGRIAIQVPTLRLPWNWGQAECVGVDADRNWDYHWGEADSSRDPCADKYAGPHPFSEPETRAVSSFLSEHRDRIKVYLSLHAYSQSWLVPSSHAYAPFADDGVLMEMGKLATAALADLYGTKYQVGTAADLRQPASGMSHDWAKARAGVKFAYHVELRDASGPYGFLLPGSQIVATAKETWQAVKAIVDNLAPV